MILLIDVGNTNICLTTTDGSVIENKIIRIKTLHDRSSDEYYLILREMLKLDAITAVAISSVVPDVTAILTELFINHFGLIPLVLGPKVKTGLKIVADNPREVGADLICDAVGVGEGESLIIDLGTATKYLYVKNRTLLGVVITPGVMVSIKALVSNTALLPDVEIKVPNKVLGNNTINCMQSGATYGVASQVDGMIERIKKEVENPNLRVVATGGLAKLIVPLCDNKIEIDDLLTLKGLLDIFGRNQK